MSTVARPRTALPRRRPHAGAPTLPVAFSTVLAVVLLGATLYGLLVDDAYRVSPGVSESLPAVLRGQDLLTLLTVPVMLDATRRARRGSLRAHVVWLGLLLYYAYSYVMYAFAPYNDAFLLYVAAIGLSGYGLLDGLVRLEVSAVRTAYLRSTHRGLAGFLLGISVLFGLLWLVMLLPAIPGDLPEGRKTYDIASAVHILDLSVVLPLLAATGVLLLRRHPAGPALAGMLLCKMLTLGLAMLFMNLVYLDEPSIGETALWGVIAAISSVWLVVELHRLPQGPGWMRSSFWPAPADDARHGPWVQQGPS